MILAEKIREWIILGLQLAALGLCVFYIKSILRAIKEIIFGKHGFDYREALGGVSLAMILLMGLKHLVNAEYVPNLYLLCFYGAVALVQGGYDRLLKFGEKFIGLKYGNGKDNGNAE